MEWPVGLNTDISFIDEGYRTLADLLDQLRIGAKENQDTRTMLSIYGTLEEIMTLHFAREEKLMTLCGDPTIRVHARVHDKLLARVGSIRERLKRDTERVSLAQVEEILSKWLVGHIKGVDRVMADACRGNGNAIGQAAAIGLAKGKAGQANWGTIRVLVVDDSPAFIRLMETVLRTIGVAGMFTACSVREALAYLSWRDVDVILCDWVMDETSGIEFTRKLRSNGVKIPIVLISGFAGPDYATRTISAGASAFIEKPAFATDIAKALAEAL